MQADNDFSVELFQKGVSKHELHILLDSGVYRHLCFKSPGTRTNWFELVTFPGNLVITGDYGTYSFSRVLDMFTFFRAEDGYQIKPDYWSEKLTSVDTQLNYKEFSLDVFRKTVYRLWKEHFPPGRSPEKTWCWERIKEELFIPFENGFEAYTAAMSFKCNTFNFYDFWEQNCDIYRFQYLWCLHAIVWGIKKYEENKNKLPVL